MNVQLITSDDKSRLAYLADQAADHTLEICQLQARLDYYEQREQWSNYSDVLDKVFKYLNKLSNENVGVIQEHNPKFVPGDGVDEIREPMFTDIGRKIDINWGSGWTNLHGSLPVKNILEEEIRRIDKFYTDAESEQEDLDNGDWQSVVEAHLAYFKDTLKDVMNKQVDVLKWDDATATAYHAISEFAHKISNNKEKLRARFRTSAYSWVRWFYQEELKRLDHLGKSNTRYKLRDRRTLNEFITNFKDNELREPTIAEILKGLSWGENRLESTYRMFDFHINEFRDMNDEEVLYTTMNNELTERQASILEMSFSLNGSKYSIEDIAEELNINEKTVRRDRSKAMQIIKDKLSFKYENKSRL